MRLIGWLLAACVVMALLKLAVAALAIALCILVLWGAIKRPREAAAIAFLIVLCSLVENSPLVLIASVGTVLTACLIGKMIERKRSV